MECSAPPFLDPNIISVVAPHTKSSVETGKGLDRSRLHEIDVIDTIKRRARTILNGPRTTVVNNETLDDPFVPPIPQNQHIAPDFDETQYAHFRPIPASQRRKQIYYEATVQSAHWQADEYSERFGYVQKELWAKVLSDKTLSDFSRHISLHLAMVGITPRTAVPSVVIFCKDEHVKRLKTVLDPARHKLYCAKNSRAYQLFKKNPPVEPPFKLEYYRTDKAVDRRAAWQIVSAGIKPGAELCGATVNYGNAQAKIGVTLRVNNTIVSTTVDHLFGVQSEPSAFRDLDADTISVYSNSSSQRTLNDDDLISLDQLWTDDPDGDDLEDLDPLSTVGHGIDDASETFTTNHLCSSEAIQGHKVDALLELPSSACYRDFTLVEFDTTVETLRPNTFSLPDSKDRHHAMRKVADKPRLNGAPVYILSGTRGVRTGRLLSNYAYLGSGPGRAMCEVWTLIFDGTDMIDQETHEVYGHIVGSNPMEHAYVVPLKDIIEDIKYMFATANVSLLEPAKSCRLDPGVRNLDPSALASVRSLTRGRDTMGYVFENTSENRQKLPGDYMPLSERQIKGLASAEEGIPILTQKRVAAQLRCIGLPELDPSMIRTTFLKTFAILALIGRDTLIKKFVDKGLSDLSLPLAQETEEWRGSCQGHPGPVCEDLRGVKKPPGLWSRDSHNVFGDASTWEAFNRAQWMFCAHTFEQDKHKDMSSERILPFVEKTQLERGSSGVLHKVKLHPGYNHSTGHREQSSNTFVLKTYSSVAGEEHWKPKMEALKAYKTLQGDAEVAPYVTKLKASWSQGETFIMLLEHADGDNLEEFMRNTSPPTTDDTLLQFWSSLLGLSRALLRIHSMGSSEELETVSRWRHGDLKPSNILAFAGSSKYDVQFKLANLEFAKVGTLRLTPEYSNADAEADSGSRPTQISQELVRRLGSILGESFAWASQGPAGCCKCESLEADKHVIGSKCGLKGYHVIMAKIQSMSRRMINAEVDIPELLKWHHDVLIDIRRELDASKISQPDHAVKWASNGRAIGSLFNQHFARDPIVDPYGAETVHSSRRSLSTKTSRWSFLRLIFDRWLNERLSNE
ncbi:cell cycle RNA binding protein whi3 [Paraconiothyrium brasiliense]|uniref:Cell cycle RNA binding protein whi3 n=1 Tax=Paraconiothyrium brasiliense TaxID=300254 RepID=A0ABR3RQ53_9PLEO